MNQDGSGDNPNQDSAMQEQKLETAVPHVMLLTLLDAGDRPVRSEIVPFTSSYEIAMQIAMIAFHKDLGDEITDDDISLKYETERDDGSLTWAGLTVTIGSEDAWRQVLGSSTQNPHIGVFISEEALSKVFFAYLHPVRVPTLEFFFLREENDYQQYISNQRYQYGYYDVQESDRYKSSRNTVPAPTTYRECIQKACEEYKKLGYPRVSMLDKQTKDLREVLQLTILIQTDYRSTWILVEPSNYDERIIRSNSQLDKTVNIHVQLVT